MEKEVIISIKGMQQFEEEDQDSIELITAGGCPGRSRGSTPFSMRRAS